MASPVIDMHTHADFYALLQTDDAVLEKRRQAMGIGKNTPASLDVIKNKMDVAGIDRICLLPVDLTTIAGFLPVSNEEIARLVAMEPDRFIGFASVDPRREDSRAVLEKAFGELNLAGLKLHPTRQDFCPDDPAWNWIYELCQSYNRPVVMHTGLSYGGRGLMDPAHPLRLEAVLASHPDLRVCMAHCGWPFVREVAALLLKYPNAYTDTACLFFDSAPEFYAHVFGKEMEMTWVDRSLNRQIMFGSNYPRFEQIRMKWALEKLPLREQTRQRILGENALIFLGGEA